MSRRCCASLILMILGTLTRAAGAQQTAEPPSPPYWWRAPADRPPPWVDPRYEWPGAPRPKPVQHWYGWQILIGFATADGIIAAGIAAEQAPISIAGAAGHLFAGPIVHLAHGNFGQSAKSLGLTLGLTAGGGLLGLAVGAGMDANCRATCLGKIFMPALVGGSALLAANLIDVIELAREERAAAYGDAASGAPRLLVVPVASRDTAGLGVAGQF